MIPVNDNVIILPDEGQEVTASGIVLPETIEPAPVGVVVAVGPGAYRADGTLIEMTVKPGDCVVWTKFVGAQITHNGVKYLVLHEKDILLVIDKAAVHA